MPAGCCCFADEVVGFFEAANSFLEVDDVDSIAFGEDIGFHFGIPAAGLMSEVDSAFEQLLHTCYCHKE